MTRFRTSCKGIAILLAFLVFHVKAVGAETDIYNFSLPSIDGGSLHLNDFRGKVLLIVNTASFCGYTDQYEGLQKLWVRYRDKGFVLIGVPSGDFGNQEHSSSKKIKDFCETTFGIDFPLTEKLHVRGPNAHPLYKWATGVLGQEQAPRWNFHKYLVGRDGQLVSAFATRIRPDDIELVRMLEKTLLSQ